MSVSVLIPCRNAAPYLAATLESVLNQDAPPAEVLVVDDGSTDDSRAVAESYGPRVSVLLSPGRGASAARNFASRLARGAFLQYVDADDLLEPHALSSRVRTLEQSGADVAISDWQRLLERDGSWREGAVESGQLPSDSEPADLQVLRGFWAPPAAIMYRRTVFERVGGWRESLPVIQDARFLLDAVRAGRVVHVPGVGARYRQHRTGSLSSAGAAPFWRDVLVNTLDIEQVWSAEGRLDASHRQALAGIYGVCTEVGFAQDRNLFKAGLDEIRRFDEYTPSRLLRMALMLERIAGYTPARALTAPFWR